jgi:uncharacterized protein YecE (DUF72 family)
MDSRTTETDRIFIGTSGYSYEDWVGPFYPNGLPKREYLSFYSAEFPVVELNFSYYSQPKAYTLERMIEKTPESFRFTIKAHQSLTHDVGENLPEAIERYRQGIQPLTDAGRLAAVLLQFPYSFHYTPENRLHLQRLCDSLSDLPKAVEFRNSDWQRDSVYRGLSEVNTALVNVDEPKLPRLPGPTEVVSAQLAYLRFHGRNAANWWKGDNVSRYDYLYSTEELSEWLPMIERMLAKARLLLVIFNNHSRGQAIQNARQLQGLLFG